MGPQRAALLQKELGIFTFADLIQHYPFRYDDRTRFFSVSEITEEMPHVQVRGRITKMEVVGAHRKKRLVARFTDGAGDIELVWFQGINWTLDKIKPGIDYVVFGKPVRYGDRKSVV